MEERPKISDRAKRLAKRTAADWKERHVETYASSIAYFFFMSIIPMIIILIQMLPLLGLSQIDLITFLDRLVPETAQTLVATVVSEAYTHTGGIISVSAIILIWAASQGMMAMRWGLNRIYDAEEHRSYPMLLLISIGYTAALLVLFAIMIYLVFAGPVSSFLVENFPDIFRSRVTIELHDRIMVDVFMGFVFILIYTFIPAGRRSFLRQIPGAVLCTVVWEIFSHIFTIYVRGYNAYTMFYGSLGTIAIMMFWLFCSFYILLIGAYFNRFCGERWDRMKKAVREWRHTKKGVKF